MTERRRAIRDLAARGLDVSTIAEWLELTPNTVRYHLQRLAEHAACDHGRDGVPSPACSSSPLSTRVQVADLLAQGRSKAEIAARLDIRKSTVSYHVRGIGARVDERAARRYDWAAIQAYYDAGHSSGECQQHFGCSRQGWYDAARRGALRARPAVIPLDELCAMDTRRGRNHLQLRLLAAGVKDGHCEACGIDAWQGEPLTLQLHHRNGVRNDNRLENLELLCPNCHSQTDNFSGRVRAAREMDAVER